MSVVKTSKKQENGRSQTVYGVLKRAILETAIPPGTKLPEDSVGESLGVSRTLVKEALVRLSGEGLVEMQRNKGACVARPTVEEGYDMYSIRIALERLVVENLTGNLSEADCQVLEAHIEMEDRARSGDPRISIRLAGEFHCLLAQMTGNAVLARYINELVSRTSLVVTLYSRPHSSECSLSEHGEILAAIKNGDRKTAVEMMARHLECTMERALLVSGKDTSLKNILANYFEDPVD